MTTSSAYAADRATTDQIVPYNTHKNHIGAFCSGRHIASQCRSRCLVAPAEIVLSFSHVFENFHIFVKVNEWRLCCADETRPWGRIARVHEVHDVASYAGNGLLHNLFVPFSLSVSVSLLGQQAWIDRNRSNDDDAHVWRSPQQPRLCSLDTSKHTHTESMNMHILRTCRIAMPFWWVPECNRSNCSSSSSEFYLWSSHNMRYGKFKFSTWPAFASSQHRTVNLREHRSYAALHGNPVASFVRAIFGVHSPAAAASCIHFACSSYLCNQFLVWNLDQTILCKTWGYRERERERVHAGVCEGCWCCWYTLQLQPASIDSLNNCVIWCPSTMR